MICYFYRKNWSKIIWYSSTPWLLICDTQWLLVGATRWRMGQYDHVLILGDSQLYAGLQPDYQHCCRYVRTKVKFLLFLFVSSILVASYNWHVVIAATDVCNHCSTWSAAAHLEEDLVIALEDSEDQFTSLCPCPWASSPCPWVITKSLTPILGLRQRGPISPVMLSTTRPTQPFILKGSINE